MKKKLWLATLAVLSSACISASAQEISGHLGFILPLITREAGQTSTLKDALAYGFPIGVTLKGKSPLGFDFEIAPEFETAPLKVHAVIHPGVVLSLPFRWEAGLRAAYTPGSDEKYGFTPIVSRTWRLSRVLPFFKEYFVEAEVPVRFRVPVVGIHTVPVAFAMHTGFVFALREK